MPDSNQQPDPNPRPQQTGPITKSTDSTDRGLIAIIVAVILIVAGGLFWYNSHKKNSASVTQTQTAGQIRQIFQVPTATPENPGQSAVEGTSTAGSSANGTMVAPRGGSPIPTPAIGKPTPRPTPTTVVLDNLTYLYKNPVFGFEIALPKTWQARTSGTSSVNFINTSIGKSVGYIEVYGNNENQSLGDLTVSLENSPDVTQISYTTLDSQPALKFTATTSQKSGLATVFNNRIYYLRGDLAKPEVAAGFKFN